MVTLSIVSMAFTKGAERLFGAFRSRSEAEAEIAKLCAREMDGRKWAEQHHNRD